VETAGAGCSIARCARSLRNRSRFPGSGIDSGPQPANAGVGAGLLLFRPLASWRSVSTGRKLPCGQSRTSPRLGMAAFSLLWRPSFPGKTALRLRAADEDANVQPAEGARNALHTVQVTVE
jgi:hypothetical protein